MLEKHKKVLFSISMVSLPIIPPPTEKSVYKSTWKARNERKLGELLLESMLVSCY